MKQFENFFYKMENFGYYVFDSVLSAQELINIRKDLLNHQEYCKSIYSKNGITEGMDGCAHHTIGKNDSIDDFLYNFYLDDYIRAYFDSEYILNTIGGINNIPHTNNAYEHGLKFHRDVRTYSGDFKFMLNMIVFIDDFTKKNGATKVVPGTHKSEKKPSLEYLEQNSIQVVGKEGTIVLFNSNLWHSAAPNLTNKPRRALTLNFSRAFIKQQMDYPRMLGESFAKNEKMRQLLGYNSRIPCNHDEWYQPPSKRMYKPGQG
jgi:hypothetical protein